jgi:hypothetical protein
MPSRQPPAASRQPPAASRQLGKGYFLEVLHGFSLIQIILMDAVCMKVGDWQVKTLAFEVILGVGSFLRSGVQTDAV